MIRKPRVLVADDDPSLLQTVSEVLEAWGAEVALAQSGAELVTQIAENGPFDLVVTDIAMPWMSGLEVMQSARCVGLATPIIVMTALDDERTSEQVENLGREVVLLAKPFEIADLESAANRLLYRS